MGAPAPVQRGSSLGLPSGPKMAVPKPSHLCYHMCRRNGMGVLVEDWEGVPVPSQAYAEGGIHEAISYYEDNMFYEILAEELSRRDMDYADITDENYDEIVQRMDTYMDEFEVSGVDHLVLEEE